MTWIVQNSASSSERYNTLQQAMYGQSSQETQLPQFLLVPGLKTKLEFDFVRYYYVTSRSYIIVKGGGSKITESY